MAFRSRAHRRGFWKGLVWGFLLAALALLGLALVFPATRYFAPLVPADASRAPEAPAPLVDDAPKRPLIPVIPPPSTPPAGDPSLVPRQ